MPNTVTLLADLTTFEVDPLVLDRAKPIGLPRLTIGEKYWTFVSRLERKFQAHGSRKAGKAKPLHTSSYHFVRRCGSCE